MDDSSSNTSNKGVGWWKTTLSVMAAFFGVQNKETLERDFKHGSVFQFVIAGLMGTALFILVVYLLVQWVMATA